MRRPQVCEQPSCIHVVQVGMVRLGVERGIHGSMSLPLAADRGEWGHSKASREQDSSSGNPRAAEGWEPISSAAERPGVVSLARGDPEVPPSAFREKQAEK